MISVFKNSLWNLAGYAIPFLVAFWAIPTVLKTTGPEFYGLVTLFWLAIGYSNILDFGTNKALCYELSNQLKNKNKSSNAITLVVIINGFICFTLCALVWSFTPELASFMTQDHDYLLGAATIGLLAFVLSIPFIIFTSTFRAILESQLKFKEVNLGKVVSLSLAYGAPAILSSHHASAEVVLISIFSGKVLQISIYAYAAREFILFSILKLKYSFKKTARKIVGYSGWLTVSILTGAIITQADRYIILDQISLSSVTQYSIPLELISKISVFASAVSLAVFPLLARTNVTSGRTVAKIGFIFVSSGAAILCTFFYFYGDVILKLWLGPEYQPAYFQTLRIFCGGVFFSSLSQLCLTVVHATGSTKLVAQIHTVEMAAFVVIAIAVADVYGTVDSVAIVWSVRCLVDFLCFGMLAAFRLYRSN